ncbi:5-epiaristolochene 1,3-dihydroxylase [Setaria viridis]|uniref:5-epiaristolochene 1,3-dihydroxylase n=1 Tax=Setaria viridis TaxID=4556 RepID=UPI003B3AFD57
MLISCYLLLALLPLVLLIFLRPRLQQRLRNEAPPLRLPPGPWRLPVIGSLHHLIMNPLKHRVLADLARRCDAPVMYLRLGELDAVVVSSPDAAREVMKTHDVTFASRPLNATARATAAHGLGLVMTPYGERWRQLRKVCAVELLSAKRVRSFRPIREDETAQLVADIAAACPPGGEPVNITQRLATLITDSSFRAMMGERFKYRDEFRESLSQMVKIAAGFNVRDMFPSSRLMCGISGTVRKSRAFHRKIYQLIDYAIDQHGERKAAGGAAAAAAEDMIDVLLRIQKEDSLDYSSLSIGTIKAVILDLFAGGSETTSTTISWAIAELMRNPSVMQKVQEEVWHAVQDKSRVSEDDLVNFHYLKLVIKETLRLHPAAPLLIPRECQEPCQILGDPKYWDEPEAFKPERFEGVAFDYSGTDFRYIPFGAGRRICPGATFALANIELNLATLIFHFDWKFPAGVMPGDVDLTEEMGITVRPKRDLYMHASVRVPLPAREPLI